MQPSYATADSGPPPASLPASPVSSLEIIERLAAVLPRLTTEAQGGGRLVAMVRKKIAEHILALPGGYGPPAGPPQITQEKQP